MTKENVKNCRLVNEPVLFNREAAIAALKSAALKPAGARGAASQLSKDIIECFELAKKSGQAEVSVSAIKDMYNAAKKATLGGKVFADRIWAMSDRNKKNKAPLLKAGKENGVYSLNK